jgi:hypothetical protein
VRIPFKSKRTTWETPAEFVVPKPGAFYWLPADANPIRDEGDPSGEGRTYDQDLDDWSLVVTIIGIVVAKAQAEARRMGGHPSDVTVTETVPDTAHERAVNAWFEGESLGVALRLEDGELKITDGRNRLWRASTRAPGAAVAWLPVRVTAFDSMLSTTAES